MNLIEKLKQRHLDLNEKYVEQKGNSHEQLITYGRIQENTWLLKFLNEATVNGAPREICPNCNSENKTQVWFKPVKYMCGNCGWVWDKF